MYSQFSIFIAGSSTEIIVRSQSVKLEGSLYIQKYTEQEDEFMVFYEFFSFPKRISVFNAQD